MGVPGEGRGCLGAVGATAGGEEESPEDSPSLPPVLWRTMRSEVVSLGWNNKRSSSWFCCCCWSGQKIMMAVVMNDNE